MAKSNFIVRGGADFSNLNKALNQTQTRLGKFQTTVNKSMKFVGAALGTFVAGGIIKSSTKIAMAVESSVDNIRRNMGEASKSYDVFVNTQSKALGMARKDAYSYGSTFSNLLGSFMNDTQAVANETESLMKAAAIISSKTGRTFDDTANRIRSGMLGSTEAIEDLGVYTQVSMLESTEAFKKFANGKSWAQLDFKVQQQIRLAAILEQAYNRYGDTLAGTTQTKQAKFLATLDNIKLNLGQAFLPIYNVVLPALTALATKIESITAHFAAVSQTIFGEAKSIQVTETQTEAVEGLGDAYEEAGKQAKGAIAPFDEINKISAGGQSSSAGASTGTGKVNLTPVTTESADKTGSFVGTIEKLKDKLQPTIDALERFKKALEPVGKFVFDNIKSFYNDALKPIGSWFLGEGLPRLLDVGSGLLNSINWSKLSEGVKNLWQALAPFAISVGEGLIFFIESMSDILKPVIVNTTDLLARAMNALAKAINIIPEDVAVALGGAIGGIATSIMIFAGATAVIGIINNIKKAIGGLLSTISKHPVVAIAAGLGALTGAVLALNKAKFNSSEIGKYVKKVDELVQSSKDLNEEIQTMLDQQDERKRGIEIEYGAIEILADKYFDLADNASKTNDEKILQKQYSEELIRLIPNLKDLIDEETGAYKGTKEEILNLITTTKEYYLVQAARESLIEIAEKQYESEKKLKELTEELKFAEEQLEIAEEAKKKRYDELIEKVKERNNGIVTQIERGKVLNQVESEHNTGIKALKNSIVEINGQIDRTTEKQSKLNTEWDYATDYITSYSTSAETDLKKVEDAVKSTDKSFRDADISGKSKTAIKDFKSSFDKDTSAVASVRGWLQSINNAIANWKVPEVRIPTAFETLQQQKYDQPYIRGYATGGFPSTGELFVGNENGIEMMGRMGNQNVVANNKQITDGIASAVKGAIIEAFIPMVSTMQNRQSGDVVLVVGEEEIARAVNRGNTSLQGRYNPVVQGGW